MLFQGAPSVIPADRGKFFVQNIPDDALWQMFTALVSEKQIAERIATCISNGCDAFYLVHEQDLTPREGSGRDPSERLKVWTLFYHTSKTQARANYDAMPEHHKAIHEDLRKKGII